MYSPKNLLTLFLAIAVLLTWYLAPEPLTTPDTPGNNSDSFMTHFKRSKMDLQGNLTSIFTAERVDHYPDDDRAELVQPRGTTYHADKPPWQLRADRGTQWKRNNELILKGDVVAHQPYPDGKRFSRIETEETRLQLDRDYLETDHPIAFTTERSKTTSIGAQAWLDTGKIHLLEQASGHYEQ